MPFVVEEGVPLDRGGGLLAEASALLRQLKIGQSFVVPQEIAGRARQRANNIPGARFKTLTLDDGSMRIGRVA